MKDVFIFMDAYKQSILQGPQVLSSFESRMSWVYRRTGSAMAITSGKVSLFGNIPLEMWTMQLILDNSNLCFAATTCSAFLCTLLTRKYIKVHLFILME